MSTGLPYRGVRPAGAYMGGTDRLSLADASQSRTQGMKPGTVRILNLLRANPEGITPLDALEHAHSLRLAARIAELRDSGFRIVTERTRAGHGRYRLVQEDAV